MRSIIAASILVSLLLVACSGDKPATETDLPSTAQVTATKISAVETLVPPPTDNPPATVEPTTTVPTVVPTSTLLEAVEPTALPTLTPPSLTGEEPPSVQVISGQTGEGAFFLGDPNAPVTVIDYSDFL